MGAVVEAFVSFPPVVHTHEDIDQGFSRTAAHLRSHDAVAIEDFTDEVSPSYSPRPKVSLICDIVNCSSLCEGECCLHNPPAWTHFQYLNFYRATSKPTVPRQVFRINLSVRTDRMSPWVLFHGDSGFLKFVPDLRKTPPTSLVAPPNCDSLIRVIENAETIFNNWEKRNSLYSLA